MEPAEQEVAARRARRLLWAFRALFYGGAALAIALLLTGRSEGKGYVELQGRTSAGEKVLLVLEGERPEAVETWLVGDCSAGDEWRVRWWAHDTHTAPFDVRDGTLRIADVVYRRYKGGFRGRREFELQADLDGSSAHGSIRFSERIWRPDGTTYVCESPAVTFSAG